jgi:hypothetical protein
LPWQQDPETRPQVPYGILAYRFLKSTPAADFYPGGPAMPATGFAAAARQEMQRN